MVQRKTTAVPLTEHTNASVLLYVNWIYRTLHT